MEAARHRNSDWKQAGRNAGVERTSFRCVLHARKHCGTFQPARWGMLELRMACPSLQVSNQQRNEFRSTRYSAVGNTTSFFSLAILRMSWVMFMEQYFGPHMLQK